MNSWLSIFSIPALASKAIQLHLQQQPSLPLFSTINAIRHHHVDIETVQQMHRHSISESDAALRAALFRHHPYAQYISHRRQSEPAILPNHQQQIERGWPTGIRRKSRDGKPRKFFNVLQFTDNAISGQVTYLWEL